MKALLARLAGARSPVVELEVSASVRLERARRLAEQGDLESAERAYEQALEHDDARFDALLALGRLQLARGDVDGALVRFEQARHLRPEDVTACALHALACQRAADWQRAREAGERLLVLRADWDQAHNSLGVTLQHVDDRDGARRCFSRALELNPLNVEALNNLANLEQDGRQYSSAVALYRRAAELGGPSPALLVNLGLALHALGRLVDAAECLVEATERDATNAEAWTNLGVVRRAQNRIPEAERCFRVALACDPRSARARVNLAVFLAEHQLFDEARQNLEAIERSARTDAAIAASIAQAQRCCGDLAAAEATCRAALARTPADVDLEVTLGTVINARGDRDGADACFARALAIDPTYAPAQYNRATSALMRGDYRLGFALYESRFRAMDALGADYRVMEQTLGADRRWQGEPVAGRRIFVWAEQGFGDVIMMARYFDVLKRAGAARVTVQAPPLLVRLLGFTEGVDEVCTPGGDQVPAFDLHAPVMSLPHLHGTDSSSVPSPARFRLDPACVGRWATRLGDDPRVRVGIVWRGSPALRDDVQRNVPFDVLQPLLEQPGCRFISLQKQASRDSAATSTLSDWMGECDDFFDTACLVKCLDLVIAVDTAVAHLAASLGVTTWLLNRHGSEWRWGVSEERSRWYPSLRIFHQRTPGDWTEALSEVGAALAGMRSA
jgi:tetratricopeptide (TPR) repeat protein